MKNLILFFDWTEAWAPIITVFAWIFAKPDQRKKLVPVIIYFICAIILNVFIDYSWKYKKDLSVWLAESNNVFYNVQSILRCIIFLIYFQLNLKGWYARMNLLLGAVYLVFVTADFIYLENIMDFSSKSTTGESIMLLASCLLYFFMVLSEDSNTQVVKIPGFWFTVGVVLYATSNFSIFLLFTTLMKQDSDFATNIWHVHNAFYLILCVCTAKAYHTYGS